VFDDVEGEVVGAGKAPDGNAKEQGDLGGVLRKDQTGSHDAPKHEQGSVSSHLEFRSAKTALPPGREFRPSPHRLQIKLADAEHVSPA
jgi:hypothetical protein